MNEFCKNLCWRDRTRHGQLFDSMLIETETSIALSNFVRAMLELEIAFFFAEEVVYPVDQTQLQAAVEAIPPAVEVPDLVFTDLQNLSWLDLIASNVAPRQVIIGEKIALGEIDVNNIMAIATHEGEVVQEGLSKNVLGDQWSALHFLVEKLHERGYHIKTDDVVITGAMGPMFPAMLGPYEIDYDDLGLIEFDVIE